MTEGCSRRCSVVREVSTMECSCGACASCIASSCAVCSCSVCSCAMCLCPVRLRDTPQGPARPCRTTRWPRWATRTALVLLLAVACALADIATADATADLGSSRADAAPASTPSTTVMFMEDYRQRNGTSARGGSREVDDDVEELHHGKVRRQHSSEYADEEADRRHHKGRGARKQQRRRLQEHGDDVRHVLIDDRPIRPAGHGGTCPMCQEREVIKNFSLAAIKEQILHKLNMAHPPNITGRRLPKYDHLADLLDAQPRRGHSPGGHSAGHNHGMLGDDPAAGMFRAGMEVYEEEDDYHAKTERIIAFPQSHTNKVRHSYQGHNVLHFRFSQKVVQSQVAKATLWVYVRGTGRTNYRRYEDERRREEDDDDDEEGEEDEEEELPPTVLVRVMRMRRGSAAADASVPFELESTAKVEQPEGDGVWVTVDVKKMVEDWFRRPRDNLGLMVFASAGADGKQLVYTDTNEEDNPKMPFIEVYLKDGRARRVRRNLGLTCTEDEEETRCCRYPLVVDFELFGWDFIIFPKRYEANYCSGECQFLYMQKYPHTALINMASNKTGPCCGPRKMTSINMLYFDSDLNVVFGVLPGMVVERCGCF